MAMTKKDYEMLASTFRANVDEWKAVPEGATETYAWTCRARVSSLRVTALGLAQRMKDGNPRFDLDRFMTACGFTQDEDGFYV